MALVFSEETGIFIFVWHHVFASFGDSPRRWGAALDTRTGATAARAERVKADIVLYIAYRCAHCASKMSDASPETASFNSCAFPFSSPWLVFPRACSSRERGTPSCGTDEEERAEAGINVSDRLLDIVGRRDVFTFQPTPSTPDFHRRTPTPRPEGADE